MGSASPNGTRYTEYNRVHAQPAHFRAAGYQQPDRSLQTCRAASRNRGEHLNSVLINLINNSF